ncbi:MAG: EscU/YscU/HrcU family type III secretion system export apparatus switch protein [Betaproteobacteria bacterium]|jgi:flagellar biosynthetic protein FlhB|nr:EscU/YscU/HrcU family type III secretion system export apparatus switch protein [Betaproteobacteria bacterium]
MDSSQDRNLPATERKLKQAHDDGQVARSKDMGHLAVLGVGSVALLLMMPWLAERLKLAMGQQLRFNAETLQTPHVLLQRLEDVSMVGMLCAVAFSAVVLGAAVMSALAVGGWVMASKPIMPDFNRINPFAGIGRLFSKEHVAEIVKLVIIGSVVLTVSGTFMLNSMQDIAMLALQPSQSALRALADWLTHGVAMMLLIVAVVAGIDVPLQIFMHKSRLKMSFEEVKQENKESNGNPQIRARQRAKAREIAQRNSVADVPKADFVLMNPTHYAVALKYDEATMDAPQVISKGSDLLAFKIREIAKNHQVPVLESPVLARALFAHAELNREIPSALFGAVAQVLAYVYRIKAAMRGEASMPDAQPVPVVPPELDPHNLAAIAAAKATKAAKAQGV